MCGGVHEARGEPNFFCSELDSELSCKEECRSDGKVSTESCVEDCQGDEVTLACYNNGQVYPNYCTAKCYDAISVFPCDGIRYCKGECEKRFELNKAEWPGN